MARINPARHANFLREELGIGKDQVIPDLVGLIRDKCKYQYGESSFGDWFSGFTQKTHDGNFLVGFNTDHDWGDAFKRFTLAHELGHLTIPEHRKLLEVQRLHRSQAEYASRDQIEVEADSFAINFLAPEEAFGETARSKEFFSNEIGLISNHFRISRYACARRFLELTDLSCTMMVCDGDGVVEYESRSLAMKQSYRQAYVSKSKAPESSLLYDRLSGKLGSDKTKIALNDWLPDLPTEIEATESVITLGYNNKYLVLITPDIADLNSDIPEDEY